VNSNFLVALSATKGAGDEMDHGCDDDSQAPEPRPNREVNTNKVNAAAA